MRLNAITGMLVDELEPVAVLALEFVEEADDDESLVLVDEPVVPVDVLLVVVPEVVPDAVVEAAVPVAAVDAAVELDDVEADAVVSDADTDFHSTSRAEFGSAPLGRTALK
ncbi:hypothetical protein LJK88_08690 [Paenibacillus sp. P26]|nr:hypothetical protein LJK88_08690 [Paenibacillus sp. P26]